MTAVSFAQRLYQFPLGVFGIALATAIFPALARQADDQQGFTETLRRGLRLVVFIGLPASVGLVLVRRPLAAVLLQGGAFGPDDSARVARVLLGYASGVWAYSMIHLLTRAMYARGDARTPVKVACVVVVLNVALNCTLIWTPLREAGLAWSTAVCAVIQVAALLWRTQSSVGRVVDAPVRSSWFRTAALTVLMALAVGVLMAGIPPTQRWAASLAALLGAVALGAGVVLAGAAALRMQEPRWAMGKARKQEGTKARSG
jgi:putative peptidoglycan lipid II flippase